MQHSELRHTPKNGHAEMQTAHKARTHTHTHTHTHTARQMGTKLLGGTRLDTPTKKKHTGKCVTGTHGGGKAKQLDTKQIRCRGARNYKTVKLQSHRNT
jgi:hypothetical protein